MRNCVIAELTGQKEVTRRVRELAAELLARYARPVSAEQFMAVVHQDIDLPSHFDGASKARWIEVSSPI